MITLEDNILILRRVFRVVMDLIIIQEMVVTVNPIIHCKLQTEIYLFHNHKVSTP